MNESLDSISSFFNKLLNIKSKDSPREQTMNKSNSVQSINSTSASNSKDLLPSVKTTSKATISYLKAGLSDILDETMNSLRKSTENIHETVGCPGIDLQTHPTSYSKLDQSKVCNDPQLAQEQLDKKSADVQIAFDLTNEQDLECLLNSESKKQNITDKRKSNVLSDELLLKNATKNSLEQASHSNDDRADTFKIKSNNLTIESDRAVNHLVKNSSLLTNSSNVHKYPIECSMIQNNNLSESKLNEKISSSTSNENKSHDDHLNETKLISRSDDQHLAAGTTESVAMIEENSEFIPPALFGDAKKFEQISLDIQKESIQDARSENDLEANDEEKTLKQTIEEEPDKKSSKNDSSENLKSKSSKIKAGLFSVIKSDKKSNGLEKSLKAKTTTIAESGPQQLVNEQLVMNNDRFIHKVSISTGQSLNQSVKKSSSFSSTTSLATSSSSDNANTTNKENDCEFSNLINEFSDSFRLIDQSLISESARLNECLNSKPTNLVNLPSHKASFNSQHDNSPPKPPTRASKLNNRTQSMQHEDKSIDSDGNQTNNVTIKNSSVVPNLNCPDLSNAGVISTIKITNQPTLLPSPPSNESKQIYATSLNINENTFDSFMAPNDGVNSSTSQLSETMQSSLNKTDQPDNKLTISVQASDQLINLEKTKLVKCTDKTKMSQTSSIKTENVATSDNEVTTKQLNKSKRSKSVKLPTQQLGSARLFGFRTVQNSVTAPSFCNVGQHAAVQKSNTMHFDHLKRTENGLNTFEKTVNRQKKVKQTERFNISNKDRCIRDVNESVDKLVNKSISRLTDKSLASIALNNQSQVRLLNEIVKNKSCSSLYKPVNRSLVNPSSIYASSVNQTQKSRIPYSKSSVTLNRSYLFDSTGNQLKDLSNQSQNFNKFSNASHDKLELSNRSNNLSCDSLTIPRKLLMTDNCLDVSSSSSSTCSLCTSMSTDSLESVNKRDSASSRTSSLGNLNSSCDQDLEFSKMRAFNSLSLMSTKMNPQKSNHLISRQGASTNRWIDGQTRSLSNLTSYGLMGYTNRRLLLKSNSHHAFYANRPNQRELSRIDENSLDSALDDEQSFEKTIEEDVSKRSTELKTNQINDPSITKVTNTNSLISSSSLDTTTTMHGMDELTCNTSYNTTDLSSLNSNNSFVISKSDQFVSSTATIITTNTKPTLNQFKSSLINRLIDSNSHLKNEICTGPVVDHQKIETSSNSIANLDDEDSNEISTIGSLSEIQQNIFNSKKSLFTKNRLLMSKTDSCRSFELNERIVDLEMQLTTHKAKFNESLNLIKTLTYHCNDLISVFNDNYNNKLKEIGELIAENQRLIKQNDELSFESIQLKETCDDLKSLLKKNLNPEFNQQISSNQLNKGQQDDYREQCKELEIECNQLRTALDYTRNSEESLNDELNNLKIKFQQNYELYERVKTIAQEKIESANQMIENANKNNERELMLAKMLVKKSELKIQKLESELGLKTKENLELNNLLDSLK